MVRISSCHLRESRPGVLGIPSAIVLPNGSEPVRTVNPDPSRPRVSRKSEPTIPSERMIDRTLDHSLLASDPPSWTLGI